MEVYLVPPQKGNEWLKSPRNPVGTSTDEIYMHLCLNIRPLRRGQANSIIINAVTKMVESPSLYILTPGIVYDLYRPPEGMGVAVKDNNLIFYEQGQRPEDSDEIEEMKEIAYAIGAYKGSNFEILHILLFKP